VLSIDQSDKLMRNIYIDCGYANGRGLNLFQKTREYKDGFEVFAFEPMRDYVNEKEFTFFKKAAWIYDGEVEFHVSSRRGGQANGLFKNPRANDDKIIKVPCIDFSKWLMDNFTKDDYIVLKMDIEGAEKEVLGKMIKDGSIDLIKIGYIEPHKRLDNDEEYKKIKEFLSNKKDFSYRSAIEWCINEYKK